MVDREMERLRRLRRRWKDGDDDDRWMRGRT